MLKQRWIGMLFDLIVRTLDALRAMRASSAVIALAFTVAALACLQPLPAGLFEGADAVEVADAAEDRPGVSGSIVNHDPAEVTRVSVPNVHARALGVDEAGVHMRTAPQLNREQVNIARFIAKRYQIAIDEVQHFVDFAYKAAGEVKLDPMLILAVISVESSFNPGAQSHQGAQGLMQVLTRVHAEKFAPFGGVTAAFDPLANIKVGARILRDYVTRLGSVEAALKSYVGAAIQPDDSGYGNKVLEEREKIAAAAAGKPIPVFVRPTNTAPEATAAVAVTPAPAEAIEVSGVAVPALHIGPRTADHGHPEHGPSPLRLTPDL